MELLNENEMKGFLNGLPKWLDSEKRMRAAVEHYFTCVQHPNMPKDYGMKIADNLLQFLGLAMKEKHYYPDEQGTD